MKTLSEKFQARYKLFLDLDGTLADFDARVHQLSGKWPWEMPQEVLWTLLSDTSHFFDTLDWMPDGEALWHFAKHLNPTILTGIPNPERNLGNWGADQKRLWCNVNLGSKVPVICCRSKNKIDEAKRVTPEDIVPVIVDDWNQYKSRWEAGGGVFVLHRGTDHSLVELLGLGFLDVQG